MCIYKRKGIIKNFTRRFENTYLSSRQKPLSLSLAVEYMREEVLAVFYYSKLDMADLNFLKNNIEYLNERDCSSIFYFFKKYYAGHSARDQLSKELQERFNRIYKIRLSLRAMKKKLLSIEIILGNLSREAIDIVNLTHFVDTKLLIDDLEEISDLYITLGPTFDFLSEIIEIDSAELESVKRIQYDNLLIMLQDRISEYQTQYSLADDSVSENSSQISCWKKIWQLLNVCLQNFRNWIFLSCAKNSNLSTNRYNYFQEPTVLINDQIENLIHLFEKN